MSLAMSVEKREAFLAEARVGVLGIEALKGGAPLLVPVWYAYEPGGEVVVQTGRTSLKARRIQQAGRFSLCVQHEIAPYRYVSVEGPVTAVADRLDPDEWSALAHRYLDAQTAPAYLDSNRGQLDDDITIRMRPERWRTADFAAFAAQFS
ncbi:pyridoxamine 5'-phosphate oxidase family protein [Streptomyces sp. QH1-20]|uniref:pyridoxamine 5'-phosphate oxidase family protein n=1 Tax=Streptomyces sp. QH1-20 TaxID=3240934 RepID=UPI0035165EBF